MGDWKARGRKTWGGRSAVRGPRPERPPGPAYPDDGLVRLFGVHAVEAALANPHRVLRRLLATRNAKARLAPVIEARPVPVEETTPRDLDRLLGADTVHQGLLLETEPLEEPSLDELRERSVAGGPLVILDHVTDPHNVGAVLRSAAAFGAAGLIMTRRHSPPLNGTLAKSASGALELVPVLLVQNLARTLEEIKAAGFMLLGLQGSASDTLEAQAFEGPVALVLGAEGKGLRQLTAQTCDRLVRITTAEALASLNVSNAAAVALHAALMARRSRTGGKPVRD